MSKNEQMVGISRRTLVKSTAIGSLALAAGGFSLPFTLRSAEAAVQQASEKVIWVETDNTGNDEYGNHQVRACLRGRSIRRRRSLELPNETRGQTRRRQIRTD